jgi:hypothetical protein
VKIAAKIIVTIKLLIANFFSPVTKVLWQTVHVAPDVKRINVFKKGTSQGLKHSIPLGGQIEPISGAGFTLE